MIYLTGDCHGKFDRIFNLRNILKQDDYIIVLGDFGYWSKTQKKIFDKMSDLNFTILFVDGNHENFDLLNSLPVSNWNGGDVHFVRDNIIHLMRGQIFTIDNEKIFTFGGATSIDKIYRSIGESWWKEEEPTDIEIHNGLNILESNHNKVDYILTHDCSKEIAYKINPYFNNYLTNNYFQMLEEIDFKKWYFGHHHMNYQFDNHICLYDKIIKLGDNL